MDGPSQRENLFQLKCLIKGNVCSLVIDGGSCTNVTSSSLVDFLHLPTTKHSSLYKLEWLSECGELRVHRQVMIKFKIGTYQDEILCDVVPMQAFHVLLGRPWKYDRTTHHDGRTNRYSFVHEMKELKEKCKGVMGSDGVGARKESEIEVTPTVKAKVALLTSIKEVRKELEERQPVVLLMHRDYSLLTNKLTLSLPSPISSLLQVYDDVFPLDLPKGLPPLRGIEHQIDFIPRSQLPNKLAYRSNPVDTTEL